MRETSLIQLGDFWSTYDYISRHRVSEELLIVIEDPNEMPPTFRRNLKPGGNVEKRMQKISQNVGMNKREASLLVKRLRDLGYQVVTPSPKGLGKKWNANRFCREMNVDDPVAQMEYEKQKWQHVFDAARLLKYVLSMY